jgi:CspA family cold shock protein
MKGKIVRVVKEKSFGFIQSGGQDYFFHRSALKNITFDDVKVGQEVTFEEMETEKGMRAEDIFV